MHVWRLFTDVGEMRWHTNHKNATGLFYFKEHVLLIVFAHMTSVKWRNRLYRVLATVNIIPVSSFALLLALVFSEKEKKLSPGLAFNYMFVPVLIFLLFIYYIYVFVLFFVSP